MKCKLILLFLLALAISTESNSQISNCSCLYDSTKSYLKDPMTAPPKTDFRKLHKEYFFCIHADSINNILKYNKIPSFLSNDCFDGHVGFWNSDHDPISIRIEILKRVTNQDALRYLISMNDSSMKRLCSTIYDTSHDGYITGGMVARWIPYIYNSFYSLIVLRYYELVSGIEMIDLKKNKPPDGYYRHGSKAHHK